MPWGPGTALACSCCLVSVVLLTFLGVVVLTFVGVVPLAAVFACDYDDSDPVSAEGHLRRAETPAHRGQTTYDRIRYVPECIHDSTVYN